MYGRTLVSDGFEAHTMHQEFQVTEQSVTIGGPT